MCSLSFNSEQTLMRSFGIGVLFLVVALRVEDLINPPVEISPPLCSSNNKNDILCEQNLPKQHLNEWYDYDLI